MRLQLLQEEMWARLELLQASRKIRLSLQVSILQKKHTKPNPQLGVTGGIVEQESPIDLSNIQIWDSKIKKGSRISMKIDEKTGKKERLNKKTGKQV